MSWTQEGEYRDLSPRVSFTFSFRCSYSTFLTLYDRSNVLTISGNTSHVTESQSDDSSYKIQERSYGSFARSIAVPPGLKESEIKATLEEGLLKVTMPKRAKDSEAKKITIS